MNLADIIFRRQKAEPETRQEYNEINDSMKYITSMKTGWQWGSQILDDALTKEDREKAYRTPIIFKGINKKARDMIYNGFKIDSPIDGEDVPEKLEDTINQFLNEKQITKIVHKCLLDALKHGNGWFEWNCSGNKEPSQELDGQLNDIRYIDPSLIIGYILNEDKTAVEYWKYKNKGQRYNIHVSRLAHFGFYYTGDNPFSISPLEVARKTIKAASNTTEALGQNMSLFGHPFMVINTTDNTNKKQVDDAFKTLHKLRKKELKVGFAGYKDTKFDMLNPASPRAEGALNHFYVELAAALEMPMMLLIGEQKGKLTGSEVELNDYYKSIEGNQNIMLSPIFHKMFKLLLGEESWQYEIYWNPLYVDEKSEVEIKTKLMKEIGELYSKHGLLEVYEARQLLREHNINIPENSDLDEPEPTDDEIETTEIEELEEPETQKYTLSKPTDWQLSQAKKLKQIGKEIIEEQDKNGNRPD